MGWRCKRCEIFLLGIAWPRSLTLSSGTLNLFEHLMLRTGTRREGGHESCVFKTHMVENEQRTEGASSDWSTHMTYAKKGDQNGMWRCLQFCAMVEFIAGTTENSTFFKGSKIKNTSDKSIFFLI